MDIIKYTDWFHDGSLFNIEHSGREIVFSIMSAEIDPSDIDDTRILSKNSRIRGKLHIDYVQNIEVSKKKFSGILKKEHDLGTIFDLEIGTNFVKISIDWTDFPPRPPINFFSTIRITGEKIWWEPIVE